MRTFYANNFLWFFFNNDLKFRKGLNLLGRSLNYKGLNHTNSLVEALGKDGHMVLYLFELQILANQMNTFRLLRIWIKMIDRINTKLNLLAFL